MQHLKKSNSPLCKCRFCGKSDGKCAVTIETVRALRLFADWNGRTWKEALRYRWGGKDSDAELRAARNIIGPTRLDGITIHMLEAVIERESKVPA